MLRSSWRARARPLARSPVRVQARGVRIPPEYLLDYYRPQMTLVTDDVADAKLAHARRALSNCRLCPHDCAVDRHTATGFCQLGAATVPVNVVAPHFGEEPAISGYNGSGTIFFSSCNLRCVFCQNYEFSHRRDGEMLGPEQIKDWMVKLQDLGNCHNINFVTPEHVVPVVVEAILLARDQLRIPIVYNTSSFDSAESLAMLDGLVDIYLADFKLMSPALSRRYLKSDKYPAAARDALVEMHRQVGPLKFTADGLAKKGVLVRHLVMPGLADEGKAIMRFLAEEVSPDTFVHVMGQYFPSGHVGRKPPTKSVQGERYSELNRPATDAEIDAVTDEARRVGLWRFNQPEEYAMFS
ncbi:uncharacterized protein V1510DRAFT_416555 [Dipodascopsis tothii]|uniref:uncharacterized protein n=1 Tax=Dipodascopsis tothii TaxID=44089 RepID=UPI0034CD966D